MANISDGNDEFVALNNALKNGAVIGFETDTVWGIGALPNSKKGVDNIYEIKNRDRSKPLILMSDRLENLLPYVEKLPPKAKTLADKFFPGAITIIVKKSDKTPDFITNSCPTVGIRVPNHKGFQNLCKQIDGGVLATTSANISNQKTSVCLEDVQNSIGNKLYKIYGETQGCEGVSSTIVLVGEDNSIKILRQGSVNLEDCV